MTAIWCVSEMIADEEDARIQHIEMTAYVDTQEAECHLGAHALRRLGENKHGVIAGKARIARYCHALETLAQSEDGEIARIAGVTRQVAKGNELGLIVTRSITVPAILRGQGICRRMLQELRRQHCGMAFLYGHSAVPQEGASLRGDFAEQIEILKETYLRADIELSTPDEKNNPEVMIARWDGASGHVRECHLDWHKITQHTMAIAA